jgi:hypothetical protein
VLAWDFFHHCHRGLNLRAPLGQVHACVNRYAIARRRRRLRCGSGFCLWRRSGRSVLRGGLDPSDRFAQNRVLLPPDG